MAEETMSTRSPTYLRPHTCVKCPDKDGELVSVGNCAKCEYVLEVRRPWTGFIVKCALEGKSDNVTVEYGGMNSPD